MLSSDAKTLTICDVDGVKVDPAGILGKQNLDGGRISLNDSAIEEGFLDIGFGGGFPNDDCDF